jgi:hypothetical protein
MRRHLWLLPPVSRIATLLFACSRRMFHPTNGEQLFVYLFTITLWISSTTLLMSQIG